MQINTHRPPHVLHRENNIYFLTSSTLNKIGLFNNYDKKHLLEKAIFGSTKELGVKIFAWVILDNHYHIEFKIESPERLPKYVQYIHGKSSKEINSLDNAPGRKIWYQYWDSSIRGEIDFWKRFNYIHQNPVKHGYSKNLDKYEFSSYHEYDKTWLEDCFIRYPIADFIVDGD